MTYRINTAAAEEKYNYSSQQKSESGFFKLKEGANRIRIMSPLEVLPQHYSKGGYTGVCIGKDNHCPGCAVDDEIAAQKKADPEGTKTLRLTRNIRWMCWIVDYLAYDRMKANPTAYEEVVKLAMFPHKIAKLLEELQNNPDYAFSDMPMPYNIQINAKNAGTTAVEYSLLPSPRITEPAETEMEFYSKQKTPSEIIELMKEKKKKELGYSGQNEKAVDEFDKMPSGEEEEYDNPDNIPF